MPTIIVSPHPPPANGIVVNETTGALGTFDALFTFAGSTWNPTTGALSPGGAFYPATDALAVQSNVSVYAGGSAPNNANGANGDFYIRSDGTVYMRQAGVWKAIVNGRSGSSGMVVNQSTGALSTDSGTSFANGAKWAPGSGYITAPRIYAGGTSLDFYDTESVTDIGLLVTWSNWVSGFGVQVDDSVGTYTGVPFSAVFESQGSAKFQVDGGGLVFDTTGSYGFVPIDYNFVGAAIYPSQLSVGAAGVSQSTAGIWGGAGAPVASGNNGDFYFRSDGGLLTSIYQKRAGAWVGIV